MSDILSSTTIDASAERLLGSLEGVLSARVVTDDEGRVEEIHILATPDLHPKQVVRNVESALGAGMGIEIDRRVVSVAQVRPDAVAAHEAPPAPEPDDDEGRFPTAPFAVPGNPRLVFVGYDARIDAARQASCRVTLRSGPDDYSGEASGPDTPQGRAEAAARATFAALSACRGADRLGLEGAAVLEAHGRAYVLVSARAIVGRRAVSLTGTAPLDGTPEEAAILAVLQATNRWRAAL